jgi:hypothetical protein
MEGCPAIGVHSVRTGPLIQEVCYVRCVDVESTKYIKQPVIKADGVRHSCPHMP